MPTTTTLKLETGMKDRVQQLATTRRRSVHWLIREAVAQYVEREERREEAWQSAQAAWAEYDATGLHASAEEADAWMAKLEAGEEAQAPECHG